jgi:serine phosphatase RsbU (regulator of sigma subunit)
MKLPEKQTRRRSLLKIPRAERMEATFWQTLLIAYVAVTIFIVVGALIDGAGLGRRTIPVILLGIVYATPISALAHFGTMLIVGRGKGISRAARAIVLVLIWMGSGAIGSLVAYGALYLFNGDRGVFPATWLLPMFVGNSVVEIAIGGTVFLVRHTNRGFQRRAAMLGQQDLLTAELQAARNVQRSLLPSEDLRLPGFDISGATDPAVEIGGDYYDYISLADGSKGILVADAAGKGVPAALIMAKFQGMVQALSIHLSDARELFTGLNDTLRVRLDRRSFITVGMLTIDFEDRCAFYRAGHNPLLIWREATGAVEICRPDGMALGLAHGGVLKSSLEPACFLMEAGDVALLYSDGLVEATAASGESYGEDRLAASLAAAGSMKLDAVSIRLAIFTALADFVGDADPHDDVTVVVVKKT